MRIRAYAVRAALLAVAVAAPVSAFKPNEEGHLGITTEALSPIERTVGSETLRFSDHALREIRDANRNVDLVNFFGVEEHFDDEVFGASTQRLIELKGSVIDRITAVPPDGEGARTDLGGALHTLQDFYSHSNWIELGNATPESRLGNSTFDSLPEDVATCPASPGTLGDAGLVSTTTGYFPFPDPCAIGSDATPPGKCRHGVEFICPEGINKDAPGRIGYEPARAVAVDATANFVNEILDHPDVVSAGATAISALMGVGTAGENGAETGSILLMSHGLDRRPRSYNVPVDSTIEALAFVFTIASANRVDVIRPSGAVLAPGDSGVTFENTANGRTISVDDPDDGRWQVRVSGIGHFSLDVQAQSPLQIDRFDFVMLAGRVGHIGFGTLVGEPKAGSTQLALADLAGLFGSRSFSLVSDKGNKIQSVSLRQGDPDAAADEFLGRITIPKNVFRFAVTGTDTNGVPYQRMAQRLYKPTN